MKIRSPYIREIQKTQIFGILHAQLSQGEIEMAILSVSQVCALSEPILNTKEDQNQAKSGSGIAKKSSEFSVCSAQSGKRQHGRHRHLSCPLCAQATSKAQCKRM
jgi:hypothetical protein